MMRKAVDVGSDDYKCTAVAGNELVSASVIGGNLVNASRAVFWLTILVAFVATPLVALLAPQGPAPSGSHYADAEDAAAASTGKLLYQRHCATCHGRYLQGQPLWQLDQKSPVRRAPAHDESGHTWQHADETIFQITKLGWYDKAPNVLSAMPGFKNVLDDREILDVIAFIKARWPIGLRASQALLNPGYAGMPAEVSRVDWKLPPTCKTTIQRAKTNW
jgi:mono/diheme cytochrome c family protein